MVDVTALRAALRAVATPDLYRRNAFRVTGGAPPLPELFVLSAEIEAARSRLRDPVARTVDEFFWFWPEAPFDGDVARADAAWEAAGTDVAHHNLAVLNHLLALDIDHGVRVAAAQWRRAYRFWLRVWRSETFWAAYGEKTDGAATVRAELPLVLARIGAAVAVRWAERRQTDNMVAAHWQLVEFDGFPDDVRAEARKAAVDAVIARIGAQVEQANDGVRRMPVSVARTARSVHEVVTPALRTLKLARADRYDAVRDAVGRQLVKYADVYYKMTADWSEGLKLLHLARITASDRIQAEINTHIYEMESERDADQRIAGPGHRILRVPTYHRPVPDLSHLGWPRDLS